MPDTGTLRHDDPTILLLGATGQIGWELARTLSPLGNLLTPPREAVDLLDHDGLREYVVRKAPDVVVNAAAYTDVDGAESDRDTAEAINAEAPRVLASAADKIEAPLIHYSTDYVFDGRKAEPYEESDPTNPLGVYGETKRRGEIAVQDETERAIILRTSWVYGLRRSNFLLTMLRLAKTRDEIEVVDDQIGAPTWSRDVAEATSQILTKWAVADFQPDISGIYHLTASGSTSWSSFASEIFDCPEIGVTSTRVTPVSSERFQSPAPRPVYSVLSTDKLQDIFGLGVPKWDSSLYRCVEELEILSAHDFNLGDER